MTGFCKGRDSAGTCLRTLRIRCRSHATRLSEIRVNSLHSKGKAAGDPDGLSREGATPVVALSVIDQSHI